MRPADLTFRILYFGLLLLASAGFTQMPSLAVQPGMALGVLAVYGVIGAALLDLAGREKALLFFESMPFFAFACVHLAKIGVWQAMPIVGAAGVAGAAILAGESLVVKSPTFTSNLAVLSAFLVASVALDHLPLALFLGLALLGLTLSGYGLARRRRA